MKTYRNGQQRRETNGSGATQTNCLRKLLHSELYGSYRDVCAHAGPVVMQAAADNGPDDLTRLVHRATVWRCPHRWNGDRRHPGGCGLRSLGARTGSATPVHHRRDCAREHPSRCEGAAADHQGGCRQVTRVLACRHGEYVSRETAYVRHLLSVRGQVGGSAL